LKDEPKRKKKSQKMNVFLIESGNGQIKRKKAKIEKRRR
jgi:hypothetical protein